MKISILSAFCTSSAAQAAPYQIKPVASDILGQSRILVMCSRDNTASEKARINQLDKSIDWIGYTERDLVVAHIGEDRTHRLSRIARCENKREFVLIGKDQTQKGRWASFPPNDELFSLIDAMPMRRFEMRQRAGQK